MTDTNTLFLAIFGSVIFLKLFLFNLFLFLQRSGGAQALPAPPSAWSLLSRSSLSSLSRGRHSGGRRQGGGTGLCSLAFGIRDKMQVIYKEMTRD